MTDEVLDWCRRLWHLVFLLWAAGVILCAVMLGGCEPPPPPSKDASCAELADYASRRCSGLDSVRCEGRVDRHFTECMFDRHGVIVPVPRRVEAEDPNQVQ